MHFEVPPKRIIYFFRENDAQIDRLKKHFSGSDIDARFLRKITLDITPMVIKNETVIIYDDSELFFSSKLHAEALYNQASVLTSHLGINIFLCINSFSIFKKDSLLNRCLFNSTHIIIFRSTQDARSLKAYFSNFSLQLKGAQSLWTVFDKYVQHSACRHSYLILCLSPKSVRTTAYSNILMESPGPMLSFHESSDSECE